MLFPEERERAEWTHRLANLAFLTHRINIRASNWGFEKKKKEYFSSSDGSSPFVITQGVLQTERWTPEHLAHRQQMLLERLCKVWRLNPTVMIVQEDVHEYESEPHAGAQGITGSREATDNKLIVAKRESIMRALGEREGVILSKGKRGALYSNEDGTLRAACTVSKRHVGSRPPYWYGYSPEWRKFLAQGQKSFLVFVCMDRLSGYAVPYKEMEKLLNDLHETPDRHWHIDLEENETAGLDLVQRTGSKISLNKFELKP